MGIVDEIKNYIKNALNDAINRIKNTMNDVIVPKINSLTNDLTSGLNVVNDNISNIKDSAVSAVNTVKDSATSQFYKVTEKISNFSGSAIWWFENLNGKITSLGNTLESYGNTVKDFSTEQVTQFKDVATNIKDSIKYDIDRTIGAIQTAIDESGQKMIDSFENIGINKVVEDLETIKDQLLIFLNILGGTATFIYEHRDDILGIVSTIFEKIVAIYNWMREHPNTFYVALTGALLLTLRVAYIMVKIYVLGMF